MRRKSLRSESSGSGTFEKDPNVSVLLIEAGEEDTHKHGGGFFKLPIAALGFQATPHHWGYECDEEPELLMQGKHWAPCEGARGRPLIQTRGKVVGGSSSINLCNYIRGHPVRHQPSWSAA